MVEKISEAELQKRLFDEYRSYQVAIQDRQVELQLMQQAMTGLQQYFQARDWWAVLAEMLPDDNPQSNTVGFRTKGQQIAEYAKALIESRDETWTTTREIFEHFKAAGISISGSNVHATVSAHLSNSGLFVNERAKGWRLK